MSFSKKNIPIFSNYICNIAMCALRGNLRTTGNVMDEYTEQTSYIHLGFYRRERRGKNPTITIHTFTDLLSVFNVIKSRQPEPIGI